jgi:hypothetical protein
MARGGDRVLRSATQIPSLHRFGLERQGHNRDSRRYRIDVLGDDGVPGATGVSTQSPSPSASDLPDAGLLHPYEPAPARFDGNLRQPACG